MATFNFLKDEDLGLIAKKLGSWMPEMAGWSTCNIAESLEVCLVALPDLESAKSASGCLRSTELWHIQIQIDQQPSYYARVSPADEGDGWEIYSMYGPDGLAQKMDAALSWIDEYIHEKYTVRVFEIAEYYITGLTLENEGDIRVYIVSRPPGLKIETDKLYRFDEMRGILANQTPVTGVRL